MTDLMVNDGLPRGNAVLQPPKMDFFSDWNSILREWLVQLGVDLSDATTDLGIGIRYFEVRWRLALPRWPRKVLRANSLNCPQGLRPALEEIARKVECGEDLSPHGSKGHLCKPYLPDRLLYDWGLHHFHLGLRPDKTDPRFVERTKSVLFAHVGRGTFHMVDIMDHGQGVPPPWAITSLYETMRSDFPEMMIPSGLPVSGQEPTPQERMRARANLVVPTKLGDGRLYLPLGLGVNTAGTSNRALERYDRMAERVIEWERTVWRNLQHMRSGLLPGTKFGTPPEFRLAFKDPMYYAVETTAHQAFPLG